MNEDFVKDGFKYIKPVRDEYDSCKEESKFINFDSLRNFVYSVMSNKYECANIQDVKKKTSSIRDNIISVVDKNRDQLCDWFKELASKTPIQNLYRQIPFFKEKEECLYDLFGNKVPISRAVWFINMSVIQSTVVFENAKKKPRAPLDPTTEWTSTLCRLLSHKISLINSDLKQADLINIYDQWDYFFNLLIALYDIDMADHWEVINWLVKTVEDAYKQARSQCSPVHNTSSPSFLNSCKNSPDFVIKFIINYLISFGHRFIESELNTRRLLYWCCTIFSETLYFCTGSQLNFQASTIQGILSEYKDVLACPLHSSICISLSSLIIFLTMSNPSAAVWNSLPFDTEHIYFKGSPLDLIPHSLVALPLPLGEESEAIRLALYDVEELIIKRSQASEIGWRLDSATNNEGQNVSFNYYFMFSFNFIILYGVSNNINLNLSIDSYIVLYN